MGIIARASTNKRSKRTRTQSAYDWCLFVRTATRLVTSPSNHQTFHRHTTHSTSRPHYLQTTTASTAKANPQTVHTKRNFQRKLRPKEPSTDCHFSAPLTPRRLHAFIESLVGVETHKRPVHRRTRPTTARRQPARRSH